MDEPNDQYAKWLAALEIYQQHYKKYLENQEWKWFYGLVKSATEHENANSAKQVLIPIFKNKLIVILN